MAVDREEQAEQWVWDSQDHYNWAENNLWDAQFASENWFSNQEYVEAMAWLESARDEMDWAQQDYDDAWREWDNAYNGYWDA